MQPNCTNTSIKEVWLLSSRSMYSLLRNILFGFDAEKVHYFSMELLKRMSSAGLVKKVIEKSFQPTNPSLSKNAFGLTFKNPVGLGAGFDKNALYLEQLEMLGFGFVEVGTVTPEPQAGNDKPRLFRLPEDKALLNRMGFNNDGMKAVADRLRKHAEAETAYNGQHSQRMIVGGNIGKNKSTPNDEAWKDYEKCFNALFDCVDYFVVNVSSPNTPGLRELQEKSSLLKILSHLQTINQGKLKPKPLLLKIAPDLSQHQVDDIIALSAEVKLTGLVAANTTISRENLNTSAANLEKIGAGGLSGRPVKQRSTELVRYIHDQTNGSLPIIASGGIFNSSDALEKIQSGACLVQVWTGFIYEGPSIVKNICKQLTR